MERITCTTPVFRRVARNKIRKILELVHKNPRKFLTKIHWRIIYKIKYGYLVRRTYFFQNISHYCFYFFSVLNVFSFIWLPYIRTRNWKLKTKTIKILKPDRYPYLNILEIQVKSDMNIHLLSFFIYQFLGFSIFWV